LLDPKDAVVLKTFADQDKQDAWVAEQIALNLTDDELETDDILIVLPDSYTAKTRAPKLISALRRHAISAHLVGVNSSVDEVFQPESVAIAHIYRAKGNEAPMVYAVDAQRAAQHFNAVTRRNTLFTAITRSRAWVRLTGWGHNMAPIAAEVNTVAAKDFMLSFDVPTAEQLAVLRHIHRDRPPEEEASVKKATRGLAAFLEAVERGELDLSDIPPGLRARFEELNRETPSSD
jgi:superfamily I DNA and RNA helicase